MAAAVATKKVEDQVETIIRITGTGNKDCLIRGANQIYNLVKQSLITHPEIVSIDGQGACYEFLDRNSFKTIKPIPLLCRIVNRLDDGRSIGTLKNRTILRPKTIIDTVTIKSFFNKQPI